MYISHKLKQENIAEYLLYMWQIEDIIRAADCDMERLRSGYLSQFGLDEAQRKELEQWYTDLIDMMHREGVARSGHLQINKNVIIWLTDLHLRLMGSAKHGFYHAAYYKALPYIVELRNKGEKKEQPELETCFDALYGVMLLRLQKKPVSKETETAVADISRLLSMLSAYYKEDKEDKLEL